MYFFILILCAMLYLISSNCRRFMFEKYRNVILFKLANILLYINKLRSKKTIIIAGNRKYGIINCDDKQIYVRLLKSRYNIKVMTSCKKTIPIGYHYGYYYGIDFTPSILGHENLTVLINYIDNEETLTVDKNTVLYDAIERALLEHKTLSKNFVKKSTVSMEPVTCYSCEDQE